jgi:AcrR family transcriptional regulator
MNYAEPVLPTPATKANPGRPRSERARLAILDATADLLVEGGLAAATMEAIAARAQVSKVTVYKWWPTRGAVAVEAFFHRYRPTTLRFENTGDVAEDLHGQLDLLLHAFRSRPGEIMAELIGQAQSNPALAETLRTRWIEPRRQATLPILERAVERGQLRPDLDLQAVMDQLYAPLYFRLLIRHQPLSDDLAATLVRQVLDGARPA